MAEALEFGYSPPEEDTWRQDEVERLGEMEPLLPYHKRTWKLPFDDDHDLSETLPLLCWGDCKVTIHTDLQQISAQRQAATKASDMRWRIVFVKANASNEEAMGG